MDDLRPIAVRLARKLDIMLLDAKPGPLKHDLMELRALSRLLEVAVGAAPEGRK